MPKIAHGMPLALSVRPATVCPTRPKHFLPSRKARSVFASEYVYVCVDIHLRARVLSVRLPPCVCVCVCLPFWISSGHCLHCFLTIILAQYTYGSSPIGLRCASNSAVAFGMSDINTCRMYSGQRRRLSHCVIISQILPSHMSGNAIDTSSLTLPLPA